MLELNPNLIPSDLKQFFRPKRKYGMWIRRNSIVWHKESVMPESVKDRFTIDFEYIYMFSRQQRYFFERQFEPLSDVSIERAKYGWYGDANGEYFKQMGHPDKMGERYCNESLGRNKRTTWTINPQGYKGEHYATYPEELCRTPIEASCPEDGIVLDPFSGVATTSVMAKKLGRRSIGIEISEKYHQLAIKRIQEIPARLI